MTAKVRVETITPLLDMHTAAFFHWYQLGLWWSLHGEREELSGTPMHDTYLVTNIKTCASHNLFDGHHEADLPFSGFFIGMLHGGALEPETGEIKQGLTTLVHPLTDTPTKRGYRAGREFVFFEAYPDQKRYTDSRLIERLRESVTDLQSWGNDEETWKYSIGCVLGNLSCHLFPETPGEREHWQKVKSSVDEQPARQKATNLDDAVPAHGKRLILTN